MQSYVTSAFLVRFWVKVEKSDGCWLWRGSKDGKGYGQITVRVGGARKVLLAHRVAYELTYGPIPEGQLGCHRCDVRDCVRPDHIFAADQSANLRDMWAKGRGGQRWRHGDAHVNAKLTTSQVTEIRHRYVTEPFGCGRLAGEYGVAKSLIHRIVTRQSWRRTG